MTKTISRALLRCGLFGCVLWGCGTRGPEGPQGPQGPQGPAGPGVTAGGSISAVVPASVTQGSEYDVTLSGFATEWTDAATVSFGPGITVTRVKAASPTSLLVHAKVAPDARADVRDVTVTQGANLVTWRNAFTVLERVKFTRLGTSSQMSLSVVRLEVNEPSFEFDRSTSGGDFIGVSVAANPGLPVAVLNLSAKVMDVVVYANADAGVQAHDLTVLSREDTLAERKFEAPQLITVTPLTSRVIVDGIAENGTVDAPYQSTAFKYAPGPSDAGATSPVLVSITSSSTAVAPRVAIVPSTGRWSELLSYATTAFVTPVPGDFYWLVVWDASGGSGFGYTLNVGPVTRTLEEEPNDAFGMARAMTVPGVFGPGQLSSLTDVDWVKVSAAAGDVGKRFHVLTRPGDRDTDTVVQVFATDGTTALGPASADVSFHENHFSGAIAQPGDYYVRVTLSSYVSVWDPAESHYDLLVTLE